jgi:hypothetical protein
MDLIQFFAAITKANFAASIYSIGAIIIVAIILWIISIIRKEPFTIKLGFATFNIGHKSKEPHTKCNEVALYRFRNIILEKEKAISKLNTEIMERQMAFCEDKINVIRDMMMDDYRTLLSKKLEKNVDIRNHECYRHYMLLVDLMLNYCIKESTFKRSMKQNHLLSHTISEWEDFTDNKVSLTFSLMKRFYDDYYPENSLVNRNEVDESNDRLFEKIRPIIVSLYRKARDITSETTERIVEIQLDIDKECRSDAFEILCVEEER